MRFHVIDRSSIAGDTVNEDRAGSTGDLAWIIDGATDVALSPLVGANSDAEWFAEEFDRALRGGFARQPLATLPARLAGLLAQHFADVRRREPQGRHEHPSASGIVAAATNAGLDYVSLGDCTLIARGGDAVVSAGVSEDDAGDRWVAAEIGALRSARPDAASHAVRAELWPKLRAARARMNTDGGYGVFSITPAPQHLVQSGSIALGPGSRILLATDGFTRLVDIFRRYDRNGLFERANAVGLDALAKELRRIENEDADCLAFPRAKPRDDATALLVEVR